MARLDYSDSAATSNKCSALQLIGIFSSFTAMHCASAGAGCSIIPVVWAGLNHWKNAWYSQNLT